MPPATANAPTRNRPPATRLAIKPCRHGTMMYLRGDTHIGRAFDQYGEYCEAEVALFRTLLRPGDVVLDVGANIGAHTIPMAQFVAPPGMVYAFEPQRMIFQILCGNVALNELSNVQTLQWALGHTSGATKVAPVDYSAENNFGGIALGGGDGEDVAVVAIDELGLRDLRLLKLDVAGMELNALMGAAATIERCRPILFVANDRVDKSSPLLSQIFNYGYRMWWHITPLYSGANFVGNPHNVFGDQQSRNVLALPDDMPPPQLPLRAILSPQDGTAQLQASMTLQNAPRHPRA
jgi:FkbM family methyltransferase